MNDILIVDDERDIRELISDILIDEGYSTRLAGTSESAMRQINEKRPSMLILDIWLKDSSMDGIDILKYVKANYTDVPVVIISGHGNIEIAVAAIKQGAFDFIEKPFNLDQLIVVIRRAMEVSTLRLENSVLKNQYREPLNLNGQSTVFKLLKGKLDKVSKSNGRVLITGPYGSGKETAARYIHAHSNRSEAPMIAVNCGAINADSADEALFGTEKNNKRSKLGFFERAQGGVLFFDEIADLPLLTQSKLLRVLIDQHYSRLDGEEQVKLDVRIISTTSRNLKKEIEAGTFREELYHRLNVVPILIPSLEDRREDIPLLAEYFLSEFNKKLNLPKRSLTEEAATTLQNMIWPGNIRQLKNIIERILIMGPHNGLIESEELPKNELRSHNEDNKFLLSDDISIMPLRDARELFEREYLLTQINKFGGNISRTAKFVGMERSALHRKLKSLGVVSANRGNTLSP
ncbi:MAG: sigma-54 dependent transcriptional regulator [Planktomarina sp.]|nr:sigma-54 dependent transcriptional regulator [Planktomarina sp.]